MDGDEGLQSVDVRSVMRELIAFAKPLSRQGLHSSIQYASSPGNRAHCFAVSSSAVAETILRTTEGWLGRVGLSGLKYRDGMPAKGSHQSKY